MMFSLGNMHKIIYNDICIFPNLNFYELYINSYSSLIKWKWKRKKLDNIKSMKIIIIIYHIFLLVNGNNNNNSLQKLLTYIRQNSILNMKRGYFVYKYLMRNKLTICIN